MADQTILKMIDRIADSVTGQVKTMLAERDTQIDAMRAQCAALSEQLTGLKIELHESGFIDEAGCLELIGIAMDEFESPKTESDPEKIAGIVRDIIETFPKEPEPAPVDEEAIKTLIDGALSEYSKEWSSLSERMVNDAIEQIPEPKHGKDADPGIIRQMVIEEVAEIPLPKDGKDADPELIRQMVADAVAEIPKPKDGKDADPEIVRQIVDESIKSVDIPAMISGAVDKAISSIQMPADGRDGRDGRDGLEIEIEPEINESKSYPRGTYAMHRGGLWRAYEKTHGMRGWDCVVNGVHEITVDSTDTRNFKITIQTAGGDPVERTFSLPTALYRGVWRQGKSEAGDLFTWGGSIWHCNRETEDKPGQSDAWTLAVKNVSVKKTINVRDEGRNPKDEKH